MAFGEARAQRKPTFTVASNAALRELLAGPRPCTLAELIEVRGIGVLTCAHHGEALLQALRDIEERDGYWIRFCRGPPVSRNR